MVRGETNGIIRWWKIVDQPIIISALILFCFSLMLVTTASPSVAARIGIEDNYFYTRQAIYLFSSSILIIFISFFEPKTIKRLAIIGFLASLFMLIIVKFYGFEVKGARRWINIAGFSYQPSEFIKPFFSVVVGWILSLRYKEEFPSFSVCMFLYLIVAILLITQPDFGMLVLITCVFGLQLFIAGLPYIWIFIALIAGSIGTFLAYISLPHVARRINNFLDPNLSMGSNYQVSKSLQAFENGGILGAGPGEGTVKLHLPDSHTDFIFAVAGEEFGAIICTMLIALIAFFVLRSLLLILNQTDKFIQFAATGLICQFGMQAAINIGVTLNVLPTKGMTLPFISYGGSSTLAISIAVGMLVGLLKRRTSIYKYRAQVIDV